MPQSPVPNTAQAVLNYQIGQSDARNVLHFQQAPDVPFDDIDLTGLGNAVKLWWQTHLRPQQPATVTLESIICRDMAVIGGDSVEVAVAQTGTNAGAISPNNVTACMTLRTGGGGRAGRGRIYHVGMIQSQVTGDIIAASFVTILTAAYNALKVLPPAGVAPEYQLVVVSRYLNGVQRGTGQKRQVTNVTMDNIVDSQRRRLTGRGA